MDFIINGIRSVASGDAGAWLLAATTVLTACTAITSLTPSKSDDAVLNGILRVLNLLAGNVARNKNLDDD